MAPVNHWPLLGVTQVATSPLNDVTGCGVRVTTLGTLKAPGRCLKFALKATLKALVNRRIRTQVTNMVIGPIPNGF